MNSGFLRICVIVTMATLLSLWAATPIENEFRVQTDIQFSRHSTPNVARNAVGDFVVTWYNFTDSSQNVDIYARRFNASGRPLGDDFRVNTSTAGIQILASIGMDAVGNFVIAWRSNQPAPSYTPLGVYGQRFDSSGQPLGTEFQFNTDAPGSVTDINDPKVTMAANGRFVGVWREISDVYARLYDEAGQPVGPEISVAKPNSGDAQPSVAMDANGNFVVAWANITNQGQDIYARLYNTSGTPLAAAFKVNSDIINNDAQFPSALPSVSMDAAGNFVIAWVWVIPNVGGQVYARRFDASGAPQGNSFVVSSPLTMTNFWVNVDCDADGDFVISWDTQRNADIIARRYAKDGTPLEDEFQVNAAGFRDCCLYTQSVALDADGDFVVVWTRLDTGDVLARRYAGLEDVDLAIDVQNDSDPVLAGGDFAYQVFVMNNAPAVTPTGVPSIDAGIHAASGVKVDIVLPAEAAFRWFDAPGWTCSRNGMNAQCTLDDTLGPQSAAAITINLTAALQPGTVALSASVDGDQLDATNSANNSDSETIDVSPLVGIASRKVHGAAGTYDVDLAGGAIECRSGGANGDYTLIFTFANPLTNVDSVTLSGIGSVENGAIGADAHQYIVQLTGVANVQRLGVTLNNVTDNASNSSASVATTLHVLVGDTSHDAFVNSADISQTKSQSGSAVGSSNFREDVTADGFLNSADIALVKSKSGTALP